MLKMIGAILIFGSSAAMGLAGKQRLQRRLRGLRSLLTLLALMESEIAQWDRPLPDLIYRLSLEEGEAAKALFLPLHQSMLSERAAFPVLWRKSVREAGDRLALEAGDIQALLDMAGYLGRYDAQTQRQQLQESRERLGQAYAIAQTEYQNKGNLYRTCGMALGALTILVLL
jgi:stage III sporulation protein AB